MTQEVWLLVILVWIHVTKAIVCYEVCNCITTTSITIYCIAGNFQGRKFLRLSLHDTFHELNFEDLLDCHRILYYNKISRNQFSRL